MLGQLKADLRAGAGVIQARCPKEEREPSIALCRSKLGPHQHDPAERNLYTCLCLGGKHRHLQAASAVAECSGGLEKSQDLWNVRSRWRPRSSIQDPETHSAQLR